MLCKNCEKEIGEAIACPHCGYDPNLDDPDRAVEASAPAVPPVKIYLKKMGNGFATAGFILGLFSWNGIAWILSFIFSCIGLSKAKYRRRGHIRSILGLLMCLTTVLIPVTLIVLFCLYPYEAVGILENIGFM